MFSDEKIDYTEYLRHKPKETDLTKMLVMAEALFKALEGKNIHGYIAADYYADGTIKVSVEGKYYKMFDSNTGKFFSGYVGDYNNDQEA